VVTDQRLHTLLYISRNLIEDAMLETEVRQILEASRRRNATLGITGALLFSPDTFVQVIEGPQPVVQALYDRVRQDPRHMECIVLADRAIEARQFGEWSMAFAGRRDDIRFADLMPRCASGEVPDLAALLIPRAA
jgi:hypothetical protein